MLELIKSDELTTYFQCDVTAGGSAPLMGLLTTRGHNEFFCTNEAIQIY